MNVGNVHTDALKIIALLEKYPQVKICLSGHLHQLEQTKFRGIHHYGCGAVSGNWWSGPNQGFAEGYSIVNLYDDGSHDYEYSGYDWTNA